MFGCYWLRSLVRSGFLYLFSSLFRCRYLCRSGLRGFSSLVRYYSFARS